jgi:asparagine synthase (glutamine-hydrolysing)
VTAPERLIAAIYDPVGTVGDREARRRVSQALGGARPLTVGPLTVGGTGPEPLDSRPLVVADREAPALHGAPASWLDTLRSARGPFALVAAADGEAIAARDHLGARPLFVRIEGRLTYLASEIPVLLGLLPRHPAPDPEALALFLAGAPMGLAGTVFSGIRPLPAAHALVLGVGGGPRLRRYWRPEPRTPAGDPAHVLLDAVRAAVRRHGGGEPGAGVLLSGGLDSSAVLAVAAEDARAAGHGPPPVFTAVFPDHPQLDERAASGAVAERWGAEAVLVPVGARSVASEGASYVERWGVPLQHPSATFFRPVLEDAARRGIRVLLDGEGGDELFGCEPLLIADRLRRGDVRGAWRLSHSLPGTGGRLDRRQARVVLRSWVLPGLMAPAVVRRLRRLRDGGCGVPLWLRASACETVLDAAASADDAWWRLGPPRWRAHLSWTLTDGRTALGVHDHLRRTTVPSGVRDSHPFLDVELVETVLGILPEHMFGHTYDRPALRAALAGRLPEQVRLRRDKVFFDVLLRDALLGPDRRAVDAVLGHAQALEPIASAAAIRELWLGGPERHPHGPWLWSGQVWRAYAAETWLRGQGSSDFPP